MYFEDPAVGVTAGSHGVAKTVDLKLKGLGEAPIRQALAGGHGGTTVIASARADDDQGLAPSGGS
jgi:hypothetical protein